MTTVDEARVVPENEPQWLGDLLHSISMPPYIINIWRAVSEDALADEAAIRAEAAQHANSTWTTNGGGVGAIRAEGLDVERLARAEWEIFGGARAVGSTWDDQKQADKDRILAHMRDVAAEYARLAKDAER